MISGDLFVRGQTILAQSNAISCWRSAETDSRPAESKGMGEQIEEAENTSTDLIICIVSYKQTTHKEQEMGIRPFSQERRAAKKKKQKKQNRPYCIFTPTSQTSSVHKCVKVKCPMRSQENFHCSPKTHLVYLHHLN